MLTRYMRAELCLVIHTVAISCLCVVTVGMMRAAVHFSDVAPVAA